MNLTTRGFLKTSDVHKILGFVVRDKDIRIQYQDD